MTPTEPAPSNVNVALDKVVLQFGGATNAADETRFAAIETRLDALETGGGPGQPLLIEQFLLDGGQNNITNGDNVLFDSVVVGNVFDITPGGVITLPADRLFLCEANALAAWTSPGGNDSVLMRWFIVDSTAVDTGFGSLMRLFPVSRQFDWSSNPKAVGLIDTTGGPVDIALRIVSVIGGPVNLTGPADATAVIQQIA